MKKQVKLYFNVINDFFTQKKLNLPSFYITSLTF